MAARDCVFVHAPKFHNEYLPLGDFASINYMPMGLPALARELRRHGFDSEVVHLGVEWLVDPAFSLVEELAADPPRAVGLPLYWHYQSYDAVRYAVRIKRACPGTFVFLGGVTASYFAEQVLAAFPEVDAVVQGHGEGPIVPLLRAIRDGTDLAAVPSLLYRGPDGAPRRSTAPPYLARQEDLDSLVFGDLSVMRHPETYARSFGFPLYWSKELPPSEAVSSASLGRTFFPLCTGRGCPVVCSFCGGNRDSLARVNGRNRLLFRDPSAVVDDVLRARDFGYRTVSLCFDPTPWRDAYHLDLFERLRRLAPGMGIYFECWGLPTERFLDAFATAFEPEGSSLALSPDTGSEEVRRRNKGHMYSNAELHASLAACRERGIAVDLFYTLALPGETLREALETRDQVRECLSRYGDTLRRVMTWTVQLEPGSPQFERPESLGLTTDRKDFLDFHRCHGAGADAYSTLGFKVDGYFGDFRDEGGIAEFERHLQHLKCMEFCFFSARPRRTVLPEEGRSNCLTRRRELAARRGDPLPTLPIGDGHMYQDAAALRPPRGARPELP